MADAGLLLDFAINGLVLGSILALAAIGLTLVYGILNLSNFAHGDYLTLGAYSAFLFNVTLAKNGSITAAVWVGTIAALVLPGVAAVDRWRLHRLNATERRVLVGAGAVLLLTTGAQVWGADLGLSRIFSDGILLPTMLAVLSVPAFAVLMDLLLWRPLRRKRATLLTFIIVSIGLALALRHLIAMRFGSSLQTFDRTTGLPFEFGDIVITRVQLTIIVVAVVLILLVHLFLRYTRVGKALRALADNPDLARASGIDVDRMILYVWIISGALAAVAGVLLALNVNVNPSLGWRLILPIFASVVLGGIGSAYGAMLGAMVIGLSMELSVAIDTSGSYRPAVAFMVLIVVLLVRPQGILGGRA